MHLKIIFHQKNNTTDTHISSKPELTFNQSHVQHNQCCTASPWLLHKKSIPRVSQVISINERPTRGSGPVWGHRLTAPIQINWGPLTKQTLQGQKNRTANILRHWHTKNKKFRTFAYLFFRVLYLCWREQKLEGFVTWNVYENVGNQKCNECIDPYCILNISYMYIFILERIRIF